MVSSSLFVMQRSPQKVLDHILLSALFLLFNLVAYGLTTNATTASTEGQKLTSTKNEAIKPISVPPTDGINTSFTAYQVITQINNVTTISQVNTNTTHPLDTAFNATNGTKKPENISEVSAAITATPIPLFSAVNNATNDSRTTAAMNTSVPHNLINTTLSITSTFNAMTDSGTTAAMNTSVPHNLINTTLSVTASFNAMTDSGTTAAMNTSVPHDFINTTLSITDTFNATTALWPMHCNFLQNCHNDSVYYWMTISVEVNGPESNESDISAWLQNLFQNQTECSPTPPTVFPINTTTLSGKGNNITISKVSATVTSATNTNNVSSDTTSQYFNGTRGNRSMLNDSETTTNIFKDVTVMCSNKTAIRQTTCTVLLQLTQPTDKCCIIQTVSTVQNKSFIQAYVVGNGVEQVVKGICRSSAAPPPIGSFEKCNGSVNPDIPCNSNTTLNVSCSGNSEAAYVSINISDQTECTFENQTNSCNCSFDCNSTAAYYIFNTETADFNFNMTQILANSTCNITNPSCQALKNISQIYENSIVMCDVRCTIIMKLSKAIDVCGVSSALLGAFQNQRTTVTDGSVTRLAICNWEDGLNADLSQTKILIFSALFDGCPYGQMYSAFNYCEKGQIIAVAITECNKNTVTPSYTNMPTSTVTITTANSATNITTTISSANSSAASLDTTVTTDSSTSAEVTTEGLLNLSKNGSSLNSTQITRIVTLLESLLSGPNVSLALGNLTINIVSNLMDAPLNILASISSRIIAIVDTVGLKLVVQGESQSILSRSVALAVKLVVGALFPETTFTISDPFNLQIGSGINKSEPNSPQGSITLPASLTANLSPEQQQLVSRVQFNFYQKPTLFQDKSLNSNSSRLISGVLGSSVANLSISNLRDQIVFILKNTETVEVNSSRACVFWKFSLNGGSGGWSSEGCNVLNISENETRCGCNHLTSFGVLLDLSREGINNPLQSTILSYITYIGCGISAIFLSVTLMTYLSFETLRKDIPSKIVIQLCLALLLLNLTFLLDAWLALYTKVEGLCISTAFFLHYFLLASFTWMAMEAVHMYIAIVKVFNTYVSRFMVKLGLAGWGIPLIVVIIVISINKDNYGLLSYGKFEDGSSDEFCWLKNDIAFYVSVVPYFCVVFVLNFSMLIVVMVQLCRIKRQNPHNLQHRSILQDVRSVAGLTVLLGLTWIFAFFAWGAVNLPFMYLFAIFNTLQGFFIFVFHCAVKENVRRQWRMYLCCGNFRLVDNSDWSHTVTQRTKKSTVNRGASSFRSNKSSKTNNSSSSFLVDRSGSDRSMGISSPFDDRTIMEQEETRSDVVLNEINNRYRSRRSL